MGVERAAGEKTIADLNSGNFAPTVVNPQHQPFGFGIILYVHFHKVHAAILQESLRATAIRTPQSAVHDDGLHGVCGH